MTFQVQGSPPTCEHPVSYLEINEIQGGSNMTGTNCDLFTHKSSRSYLNHLVLPNLFQLFVIIYSMALLLVNFYITSNRRMVI